MARCRGYGDPSPVLHDWDNTQEAGSVGGLCNLHLLMVNGGKERTLPEYSALLNRAGFALDGMRELSALPSIIVGVAQ